MGELTEAPEAPFYCFVCSNFLSPLFCCAPPLLPAERPSQDCYSPKVDSNSGEGDSDTYRLGFSLQPAGLFPPSCLGSPQPDRMRASCRIPLSPSPSHQVVLHFSFWSFSL